MEIPTRNVDITSEFWSIIRDCSRTKTIPALVKAQKDTGHWDCLKWKEGHEQKPHPFWDSDIYKATEAACYFLMTHPDETMMAQVEEAVDNIRAAQHPDGYINSYYTVRGVEGRWTNLRDMHELYCLGHLIEACVAYETLTKSGRLLEPVMKVVRHIDSIFGSESGKKRGYPGHEEIEIGLLRLYEQTREPLLLKVAQYFILERGSRDDKGQTHFDHEAWARGNDPSNYDTFEMRPVYRRPRDYAYHQADRPLIEETELRGHSVRAMYLMTAATDLVRLTNHAGLKAALDRLWRDMVDGKMYITGGLGSVKQWEGFSQPYVLHDTEEGGVCYAETCATFALIVWCQRMLRLRLISEYADVMEICLYNGFLGAVGLDGESFYYENPLRTMTGRPKERSRWFHVACCPPNVAKLMGNLGAYIFTLNDNVVAIHLYIASVLRIPGTDAILTIKTKAPWSGEAEISWRGTAALALRIPAWASGYKIAGGHGEAKNGYLHLPETENGEIEIVFGLEPKKMYANPKLGKNEVCIMRGPLVYCIEDVDNDLDIDSFVISEDNVKDGAPMSILDHEVIPVIAKGRTLMGSNASKLYDDKPWAHGKFNRHCYGEGPIACPYTGDVVETTRSNGSTLWEFPYGLSSAIPDILQEIFSSGTAGQATTISNFFDIEWRQLSTAITDYYDNGTESDVGLYRQLDSFILQDAYKIVEGLIVDAKTGGIGFRSHTIPTGVDRGATWEEDLLFIEPDASCVNTNLTFDFEISTNFSDIVGIRNLVITDRGGFTDIDITYQSTLDDTAVQSNPDLQARAYEAAYLNNAYTMMVYNITNPKENHTDGAAFSYLRSEIGKTFPLKARTRSQYVTLGLSAQFGNYLDLIGKEHLNPYNITSGDLNDINNACAGTSDMATISNVYVGCGLLQGAPVRVDGGPPSIFDKGSKWSSSLHSCAATVRATIKTVSFSFNTTDNSRGLEGLAVTNIEPKAYASEADHPLWGFEESGLSFDGFNPIWGLISPEYEAHENVSTVRQPFFYIPGVSAGLAPGLPPSSLHSGNNLPGSTVATSTMNEIFNLDPDRPFDLHGAASMSIFTRWQSLSSDSTGASTIIKLLWTDLAASAVVGTRGALGRLNKGEDETVPVEISPLRRRITYDLLYGIPAILLLLFIVMTGLIAVISTCLGKVSVSHLRLRMLQLSSGRIFTTFMFPQNSSLTMPSGEWSEKNGSRLVKLGSISERDDTPGLESQGLVNKSPE
ncbi:uncharacterized protein DNG_03204 [Cephalotrichum gorgonifer]|uniref:DUF1680 domain-containing protein n=1 Tax=Cephalotrichum gorgonifer TaxID=2041049 RepID=A0AAE8MVI4_9PEZI|nr:uncharacterized protein DNG_03204 [Cephalotrichum gorgonifer]